MSSTPPHPPSPRPRITVAQREAAEARLRRAAGDGLLTLEEYGDRVRIVLEAVSRDELEAATADLTALGGVEVRNGPPTVEGTPLRARQDTPERVQGARRADLPARATGRSPARHGGRWLAGLALAAALVIGLNSGLPAQDGFALFGSDVVNVTGATENRPVSVLVAFGSIEIIVPEGAQVEMDGIVIFGSRDCAACQGGVGDPVIRIRGNGAFGSIEVREAPPADS